MNKIKFCFKRGKMKEINWKFLWAKKQSKNGTLKWLSLYQHLIDTWYVCGFLWDLWLSQGQKIYICKNCGNISENKVKRLIQFIGFVHDIGKATPAFQTQKGFGNSEDLDKELLEKLENNGFQGISQLSLANRKHHTEMGEAVLIREGVNKGIASIVGGHHGKPLDDNPVIGSYPKDYYQVQDENSEIYKNWKEIQKEILNLALQKSGFENVDELPYLTQPLQVLIEGIVITADWIASNEEYFPLFDLDKELEEYEFERAEKGFVKWRKSNCWEAEEIIDINEIYEKRFGFLPHEIQKEVFEIIENIENPGIVIYEAPMGTGKTETALIASEQLAYKKGAGGIFFGLPTQATSNTMFSRVHKWLESIAKETDSKFGLRLQHGKAELNEEYEAIKNIFNNYDYLYSREKHDEMKDCSIIVNSWMAGRKKSALDDFVVGTVDQVLLMALKQKHLALRHLGFTKKAVIIDEVHAYDAYMSEYLYRAIHWLGAYNVTVIILLATLPKNKRFELLENYMRGMGYKWKECEKDEQEILTDAYPLLTYNDDKKIHVISKFSKLSEKKIILKKYENGPEESIEKIYEILKNDGIKGIIVNTVKKAQKIAEKCVEKFGDENVEVLHSAFIACDRIKKENYLMSIIGKDGKRPKNKIVIGTQVLEQSLDIDFDVLITELAPVDLLLQRTGRLHRHGIERPEKFKIPTVHVFGVNENTELFDEGTSYIYSKYILAKTVQVLKNEIVIPKDISKLVQKVYDEGKNKENSQEMNRLKEEYEINKKKKEIAAAAFRLDKVKKFKKLPTLHGWISNSDNCSDGEAQVRDIEERIEVIALKKVGSGYGTFSKKIDISSEIYNSEVAKQILKQTMILPSKFSYKISSTIKSLEKMRKEKLKLWDMQPWLNGELAIIFDENNKVNINGTILEYSEKYGLKIEEKEV